VSVVMLHTNNGTIELICQIVGENGRSKFGMEITSNGFNLAVCQTQNMPSGAFKKLKRFQVFYVAYML